MWPTWNPGPFLPMLECVGRRGPISEGDYNQNRSQRVYVLTRVFPADIGRCRGGHVPK